MGWSRWSEVGGIYLLTASFAMQAISPVAQTSSCCSISRAPYGDPVTAVLAPTQGLPVKLALQPGSARPAAPAPLCAHAYVNVKSSSPHRALRSQKPARARPGRLC
jgi:hypothetical protein